jgi:hypothetical protein
MATKINRDKLARELCELRKKYALSAVLASEKPADDKRDLEICALLKQDAAKSDNFRSTINGLGQVTVSAPHDKAATGETYEFMLDIFLAASDAEKKRLMDKGYVKKVMQYSGAYYGAVTVELFP